jgi:hypothetical protein
LAWRGGSCPTAPRQLLCGQPKITFGESGMAGRLNVRPKSSTPTVGHCLTFLSLGMAPCRLSYALIDPIWILAHITHEPQRHSPVHFHKLTGWIWIAHTWTDLSCGSNGHVSVWASQADAEFNRYSTPTLTFKLRSNWLKHP